MCCDFPPRACGKEGGACGLLVRAGLYGFVYAVRHIGGHTRRLAEVMIAKDRQGMSADELAASEARLAAYQKKVKKASLKRLVQVLSPFYNPARRVASPGMAELLARY